MTTSTSLPLTIDRVIILENIYDAEFMGHEHKGFVVLFLESQEGLFDDTGYTKVHVVQVGRQHDMVNRYLHDDSREFTRVVSEGAPRDFNWRHYYTMTLFSPLADIDLERSQRGEAVVIQSTDLLEVAGNLVETMRAL